MSVSVDVVLNGGKRVVLRKPKVSDLLAVDGFFGSAEKEVALICNLTEIPPEELKCMYLDDYAVLQKELEKLMGKPPK